MDKATTEKLLSYNILQSEDATTSDAQEVDIEINHTQSAAVLSDESGASASLSPYVPILYIGEGSLESANPTLAQEIFLETAKYSITPTTLRSRKFIGNETIESKVAATFAEVRVKIGTLHERYDEFKQNVQSSLDQLKELSVAVIAEGEFIKPVQDMLVLAEKFSPKIAALESYRQELHQYLSFIEKNKDLLLSFQDLYCNTSGNSVTRFGINTTSMSLQQTQALSQIYTPVEEKKTSVKSKASKSSTKDDQELFTPRIHPLEASLIRDAVDFCISQKQKTVLVDIFARNDNGAIILQNTKPETHTILLYIQEKDSIHQVIVIDPSNSDFSKHLAANTVRIFAGFDEGQNIEIITPSKQLKIYSTADKDNVGPRPDQYRDCIDVSVKIAFGLNKFEGILDIKTMTSLDVIQEVTNQKAEVNDSLFFDATQAIARIRQASEDGIREQANKLLTNIDKQIKGIYHYFNSEVLNDKVLVENIHVFNSEYISDSYRDGIKDLLHLYSHNKTLIAQMMTQTELDLKGEIASLFDDEAGVV